MKKLCFILALALTGCVNPEAKYSDLYPPPTATIADGKITIHIGGDRVNSALYTLPKAKIEGQTVYVFGGHTMVGQSREFVVWLPASVNTQSVSVIWIDPDGSHIPVPTRR